ncbi:Fe2+-dependent dioxygenase [Salinisphaera sp.]|uniref:Fe2+-dependent dioxygenase n=1 Tax=Salinisphaera sp. TaxID=1914330 RepID=UPI000C436CC1|nr:Fe2+-dependent dioxygenase [Salinisphaera sp.]MAS08806.1 Fe2+-dependent dioxygenase [Salinisphaera sp.]|tara:strand:+ start:151 stop:831 length:681 start_codon:yes stop_codon:yes gene_type:complete
MLITIPDVLSPEHLARCRARLEAATWVDGNVTSGHQSARAKNNEQVPEESDAAREVGGAIMQALSSHPTFMAAALPQHVFPPLFNRYGVGHRFGAHIDNSIRQHRQSGARIRTDLSATLFFAGPEEYDGGELVIEDNFGTQNVKLPAGHLVLYPASSLHHVTEVTRGRRMGAFFWIQSMIRDDGQRRILWDMDRAIQELTLAVPDHPSLVSLTGTYHNLLRRWADV